VFGKHTQLDRQYQQRKSGAVHQTGFTPAEALDEDGNQWPDYGGTEPRNRRDPGDRAARVVSIELSQSGKQRVVESGSHSDTDHHPGHNKTGQVGCAGEQDQAQRDDEATACENQSTTGPGDQDGPARQPRKVRTPSVKMHIFYCVLTQFSTHDTRKLITAWTAGDYEFSYIYGRARFIDGIRKAIKSHLILI